MKTRKQVVLAGVLMLSMSLAAQQPAWAARTRVHEAAESQQYGRKFGGMIGRGVLNVFTSFVDVIVHTVKGTAEGTPVVGTLTGLGRGLGCGLLRLGSGAVDVTTFWVPGFNGVPVSDSYDSCESDGSRGRVGAAPTSPEPRMTRRAIMPEPDEPYADEPAPKEPKAESQPARRWSK